MIEKMRWDKTNVLKCWIKEVCFVTIPTGIQQWSSNPYIKPTPCSWAPDPYFWQTINTYLAGLQKHLKIHMFETELII